MSAPSSKRRILIICHANTSRSIIAEAVLLRLLASQGMADRFEVRSGGIAPYARDGSLVSLDARFVLRDIGIHLPEGAGATDLKRQRHLIEEADVILAMTDEQRRMLGTGFPRRAASPSSLLRELAGETGDTADPASTGRGRVPELSRRDRARLETGQRLLEGWRCSAFKKAPKLEMAFTPKIAIARELASEVEVAALVVKNVGSDAELTRSRWCSSPARAARSRAARGPAGKPQRNPRWKSARASVAWTVKLAAPMWAPAAEIQLNTRPAASTSRSPARTSSPRQRLMEFLPTSYTSFATSRAIRRPRDGLAIVFAEGAARGLPPGDSPLHRRLPRRRGSSTPRVARVRDLAAIAGDQVGYLGWYKRARASSNAQIAFLQTQHLAAHAGVLREARR